MYTIERINKMSIRRVALHNLGCKVNAYETEAMQQLLVDHGYTIVPFEPGADIYIINTCTVTNIADRKSRQMLHKAKKMNPSAIVVAVGCYVQASKEDLSADDAIDIVIGNNRKKDLITILQAYEADHEDAEAVIDVNHTSEYENLLITRTAEHTRAYIKVQDGCNQFCSYCIIPYARGRVRSRHMDDVQREVEQLAEAGYQEIVLTGIHLSSYGIDFQDTDITLLDLIRTVHEIEGISRIRLGSLEPRIITEEFARGLSLLPKMCPHFHLSLQSGCDATLQRMNRRYDTKEFEEKCSILRAYFDNPALTTDIIVGFPGETEEEFAKTEEFLKKIKFYETHIFKYSRRKGTKAADMDQQVVDIVKSKRSQRLIQLGELNRENFENSYLGKESEILFEEKIMIDGQPYFTGHTKEYIKAASLSHGDYTNKIQKKKLMGRLEKHLLLCDN